MIITITLRGAPGMRHGDGQIGERTWQIVTWHKKEMGEVEAHTACGKMITFAVGKSGVGGVAIGSERWTVRDGGWAGMVFTGKATLVPPDDADRAVMRVTDAEMAAMLPGCGWE